MRRPSPKRSPRAPARITADQVAEGLWVWLGERRWFLEDDVMEADVTQEHAAQQAVLMLARGDDEAELFELREALVRFQEKLAKHLVHNP